MHELLSAADKKQRIAADRCQKTTHSGAPLHNMFMQSQIASEAANRCHHAIVLARARKDRCYNRKCKRRTAVIMLVLARDG